MGPGSSSRLLAVLAVVVLPAAAQGGGMEPIDTDYDRSPAVTVVPEYPEKARRERMEGEVQVCFDVSREGFPRRVKVRHSTHRYFEKSALKAVRRSTWRPVPPGTEVPGIKGCRTFRFRLEPIPLDERD